MFLNCLIVALAAACAVFDSVNGQSSSTGYSTGGSGSSNISQSPGGMLSVRCGIIPGGHVIWYKQQSGAKMEFAKDSYLTISDERFQLESKNGAYVLSINPTEEGDSGIYICESNSMDGVRYTHTFTIKIGEGSGASRVGAAGFGTIAAAAVLLLT